MTSPTVTVELQLTPRNLAEAFWEMGSDNQASFFEELSIVISRDSGGNYAASLQWFYLAESLKTNRLARETLMDIAAPLYLNTLNYTQ